MNWAAALAISQSVGFVFAVIARMVPAIPNRLVPKIGFITILLTNLGLMWDNFVRAAGLIGAPPEPGSEIAMGGIGSVFAAILKPIAIVALPVLLSTIQYWVNKWTHDNSVKVIASKTGHAE